MGLIGAYVPLLPAPTIETVTILLLLASLVAAWIGYLRIPYTVGLVLAGIALDVLGVLPPTTLTPDLFLWVLLPPLLFEAAFILRWDHLRSVAPTIVILATIGVLLSALVTAATLALALGLPWTVAALFGATVAATDPVAVVAFFRRAGVDPKLRALIEGESLLNDGTSVVLVSVLTATLAAGRPNALSAIGDFCIIALGGLVVGILVGLIGSVLQRGVSDHLAETMLSVVVAYGSYLLAHRAGVSGVLAVVAAGSVLGNFGRRFGMSNRAREEIDGLWEFLAFVANSLVFLLLGVAVHPSAIQSLLPVTVVGVIGMLAGRACVSYGLGSLIAVAWKMPSLQWRHVLFWGGLRGALPVVVAISVSSEPGMPPLLQSMVLGVVVVSLVIQGISLEPVLRRTIQADSLRA